MATEKFISYIRVSTARQGKSRLGLEAQQQAIANYLNGGKCELIGEYIEIESGKRNNRPKLQQALSQCRMTGATLIIAKIDRLSRNAAFTSALLEAAQNGGVKFVACDFPEFNPLVINILAAVADHEGKMISQRIKLALAAKKARGEKMGTPTNLTIEARRKGSPHGIMTNIFKADTFAEKMRPLINEYLAQGMNLSQTARHMNAAHILTARGKASKWTAQAVKNVLKRKRGEEQEP